MKSKGKHIVLAALAIWFVGSFIFYLVLNTPLAGTLLQGWIGIVGFVAAFAIYGRWLQRKSIRRGVFIAVAGVTGILFASNFFFWFPILGQRPVGQIMTLLSSQFLWVLIAAGLSLFLAWFLGRVSRTPPRSAEEQETIKPNHTSEDIVAKRAESSR